MTPTTVVKRNKTQLLKIGLITAAAILAVKWLNTLLIYHLFSFDKYLALVAISFLLAGRYLLPLKSVSVIAHQNEADPKVALTDTPEFKEGLKTIRYSLTNREFEVFRHLAEGKSNKEISAILGIQTSTIKTHTNNLFAKLKCKNRKEAIETWGQMVRSRFIL